MPLDIIIGTQWGDEGKGRIVDLMSADAAVVARFNGGDNAGHTVTVGKRTFKLHLIPSGIIQPHPIGVMGNGVAVNPATLLQEMDMLREAGVVVSPERLKISYAAHLITPAHRALDKAQEKARGKGQIGTTGRGIGPVYTDKSARVGLRMEVMLDEKSLHAQMLRHIQQVNHLLTTLYQAEPIDPQEIADLYVRYAEVIRPYIADVSMLVYSALRQGKGVLGEGAQGTLLDLDHGTYPFVTSSTTTAAGALVGLGIGPQSIGRITGVTKAFQTRVGEGPFPTEVFGANAERLRGTGANPWDEFGTTTGRPRRVGWLDGVLLRYAVRVNGMTELVVTKLDILSGLPALKLCTGYQLGSKTLADLPLGPADLSIFTPVYEELPGWEEDLTAARSRRDLPEAALGYLRRIEELAETPIRLVSVGPEREQVIYL
jgi:adenylosuccinate synthase